jgi:hypothetical protein
VSRARRVHGARGSEKGACAAHAYSTCDGSIPSPPCAKPESLERPVGTGLIVRHGAGSAPLGSWGIGLDRGRSGRLGCLGRKGRRVQRRTSGRRELARPVPDPDRWAGHTACTLAGLKSNGVSELAWRGVRAGAQSAARSRPPSWSVSPSRPRSPAARASEAGPDWTRTPPPWASLVRRANVNSYAGFTRGLY